MSVRKWGVWLVGGGEIRSVRKWGVWLVGGSEVRKKPLWLAFQQCTVHL